MTAYDSTVNNDDKRKVIPNLNNQSSINQFFVIVDSLLSNAESINILYRVFFLLSHHRSNFKRSIHTSKQCELSFFTHLVHSIHPSKFDLQQHN